MPYYHLKYEWEAKAPIDIKFVLNNELVLRKHVLLKLYNIILSIKI